MKNISDYESNILIYDWKATWNYAYNLFYW